MNRLRKFLQLKKVRSWESIKGVYHMCLACSYPSSLSVVPLRYRVLGKMGPHVNQHGCSYVLNVTAVAF